MSEHTRPATKYECGKVQYWIDNGIVTGDTATRLQTYLDNHMLNNWGFKEAQKMSIEHAQRQKKTVSSEVAPKPRKIEVEYVDGGIVSLGGGGLTLGRKQHHAD